MIHGIHYALWLSTWCLFYTLHPNEDFTPFDAFYFGIITSTTIGYGSKEDGIPRSTAGKIFCLITTMFGVLSLALVADSLSKGLLAVIRGCSKRSENNGKKKTAQQKYQQQLEQLLELPKSGGGKLDRFDFVCQMLVGGGKCKKQDIKKLNEEFDRLDINGDGVLDEKDFQVYKQNTILGDEDDDGSDDGSDDGIDDVQEENGNHAGVVVMEMANIHNRTEEELLDDDMDIGLR